MITELLVAVAVSTATNVEPLVYSNSAAIESILTPPAGSWSAQFNNVVALINTKYNTQGEARSWTLFIMKYTKEVNIDPKLFASLIRAESHGNPNAISVAGAIGLTQVIPKFWNQTYPICGQTSIKIKLGEGFTNPKTSICYGTRILNFYLHKSATWILFEVWPGLTIPIETIDMQYALNLYSGFAGQYANNSSPYSSRITGFFEGEI